MSQKQNIGMSQMLPPEWQASDKIKRVMIHAYRVARPDVDQFKKIKGFGVFGCKILPIYGELTYQTNVGQHSFIGDDGKFWVKHGKIEDITSPNGAYLLIMTPLDVDGNNVSEGPARERIKSAVGYIMATVGKNMVFSKIYERDLDVGAGTASFGGPIMDSPLNYKEPALDDASIAKLMAAQTDLDSLGEELRERIKISVRWAAEAAEIEGLDGFLKYWFAIEILSMPDTSNIRPLNDIISSIYGGTASQSNERFKTGRILNLRSKVVHEGLVFPVDGMLIIYLGALFSDVLAALTGGPFLRKAEEILNLPAFDLDAALGARFA